MGCEDASYSSHASVCRRGLFAAAVGRGEVAVLSGSHITSLNAVIALADLRIRRGSAVVIEKRWVRECLALMGIAIG